MRFVVYGAGAIGGVVGARLFEHGHDVALIARGAHHDRIREHGLTLECGDERVTLPIPVAAHPAALAITPDDVVLLAVKSQDTVGALADLSAATERMPAIVCMQNGVENERATLRRAPAVYGVCVMCPAAHLEPGVVQASSAPITGLLDIGRYPAGVDERAEAIAASFCDSTFESIPRPDVMRWKYTKLLMNLANAVQAVCGADDSSGELVTRVRREGVACLEAAGIDFASRDEDRERRGDRLTQVPVRGETRGGGSSWQSLARATGTIESDYLNGEIVLLGRRHNVPTPANALCQELANRGARERRAPGWMTVSEVMARLDAR
jgi:2-dehydropantoate 2-reductase